MVFIEALLCALCSNFIVLAILAIIATLTIYHFWYQSLEHVKLGNKLPGFHPLPIIGDAHKLFQKSRTEILEELFEHAKYNDNLARIWLGRKLIVALLDPRDIKLILGNEKHLDKGISYNIFKPWLKDGILLSTGDKWRKSRTLLTPLFHESILQSFFPVFNKYVNDVVELFREHTMLGDICDVHDYMSLITVDSLFETFRGIEGTKREITTFSHDKIINSLCNIFKERRNSLWKRCDYLFEKTAEHREQKNLLITLNSFTKKLLMKKRRDYAKRLREGATSLYSQTSKDVDNTIEIIGEEKPLALIDYLIEASQKDNSNLTDDDIDIELDNLFFGGHDTTASAASFTLSMLGVHQDVQDKVYEELVGIFQHSKRPVTLSDAHKMKYLDRVILETQRLYPAVPVITRTLHEDVKLASGDFVLPKDTTVVIGTSYVHRDAENFPDGNTFNPDNFLPDQCENRHEYSFIPFGAGPRTCIGRNYAMLNLKVILAVILRNFRVKSVVGVQDFDLSTDMVLGRNDGFRVVFEERRQ